MCNQLTTALHSHSQPASNEQHTNRVEYKHKKVKSHIDNEFYFLLNLFKSSLISFHGNERPNIPFTGNFSSLLLLFKNQSLFSNGSSRCLFAQVRIANTWGCLSKPHHNMTKKQAGISDQTQILYPRIVFKDLIASTKTLQLVSMRRWHVRVCTSLTVSYMSSPCPKCKG